MQVGEEAHPWPTSLEAEQRSRLRAQGQRAPPPSSSSTPHPHPPTPPHHHHQQHQHYHQHRRRRRRRPEADSRHHACADNLTTQVPIYREAFTHLLPNDVIHPFDTGGESVGLGFLSEPPPHGSPNNGRRHTSHHPHMRTQLTPPALTNRLRILTSLDALCRPASHSQLRFLLSSCLHRLRPDALRGPPDLPVLERHGPTHRLAAHGGPRQRQGEEEEPRPSPKARTSSEGSGWCQGRGAMRPPAPARPYQSLKKDCSHRPLYDVTPTLAMLITRHHRHAFVCAPNMFATTYLCPPGR